MRVKQMQAMVAATLLFGGVLLGTHTSYAALGKVVDIAEVKESEADRTSYRGRVEKPIDEVYAPREAKTDKNEIKAEAKPQDGTAAVKQESASKVGRESTVAAFKPENTGSGKTGQATLAPSKPKESAAASTSAASTATAATETVAANGEKRIDTSLLSYDVSRFTLPEDAKSLIVVEGFAVKGGKDTYRETKVSDESRWNKARVTVFVKNDAGKWEAKIQSAGVYGYGGMSAKRKTGDGTTPIGLWKTDTPFGRNASEEGFPSDYTHIQADAKRQYWSDQTNRLESSEKLASQKGEKLWEDWAKNIYAYALNTGFNKENRQPGTGSALFLHCTSNGKPSTAGCVAIQPEAMKAVLRQYAKGGMYIAQAPEGQFEQVYGAFSESGASAKGEFTASAKELPATETVVLQ